MKDNISKELLPCPECGEKVHTEPAEDVPNQTLRHCLECGNVFFMDLDAPPEYPVGSPEFLTHIINR